jgi:hypothetical protein
MLIFPGPLQQGGIEKEKLARYVNTRTRGVECSAASFIPSNGNETDF